MRLFVVAKPATSTWKSGKLGHSEALGIDVGLKEEIENTEKLSLAQVFASVMASFFGVQKNANRERDFKRGRARDFIVVGLVLTLLFILAVWGVVQLVVQVATKG